MINETIVTTTNPDGSTHIAPMGMRYSDGHVVIAPFRPSTTLDNLLRQRYAVVNMTDDVRVFAGCLIGRCDWPTLPAARVPVARLRDALSHIEVEVSDCRDDPERPAFHCRELCREQHAPFMGLNRAKAAVIEAAILSSRLHFLDADKVAAEIDYLKIAVDKTAGRHERQAWEWLMRHIEAHRAGEAAP